MKTLILALSVTAVALLAPACTTVEQHPAPTTTTTSETTSTRVAPVHSSTTVQSTTM